MLRITILAFGLCAAVSGFSQRTMAEVTELLREHSRTIGIDGQNISEFTISNAYTSENLGITHLYLQQRHQDIPLYNGILNLNLLGDKLISFGNRWVPGLANVAPSHNPNVSASGAVTRSAGHLGTVINEPVAIDSIPNGTGQVAALTFSPSGISREDIRAELVWLKSQNEQVLLCWKVEIHELDVENVWLMFIDAHTGAFVRKDNLVQHCSFSTCDAEPVCPPIQDESPSDQHTRAVLMPDSTYNVYPMPVESPNHGSRAVLATPWNAAGAGNQAITLGWHNDGTTGYTITRGNNVHAYEDFDNDNNPGYSPDTNTLDFNYPFDPAADPADNIDASVTNLFYWNNIIHDVMYQYGFDEVSGNFQNDNLGRGGNENDYVRAEAQDGGGTNNANFFTPSDGNRPRMQMYLWSPVSSESPLTINSPDTIMGSMDAVESDFSNNNKLADVGPVTGDLILVEDEEGPTHQACGNLTNGDSLAGKIAVIDRGECTFVTKVKKAQDHGAIAVIVVNNVATAPFAMSGNDNSIMIPAVMVSLNDGDSLKSVMDTATVNATMEAVPSITPIGDFDNGVVTHEYGHGISNRLTGGPTNVGCLNNDEQMGEGWSDFFGLMLTTDWTTATASDHRGIGTYVLGEPTNGTGIRTYPYTTDTMVNPFTYADVADAPTNMGNPSPHFVGSVWCTMLWDMTWKIIEQAGTDPDMYAGTGGNNIALQLVIDGLKLQPCNPGFVDGRDAILLADQIRYGGQYSCAIWEAFAARGLGFGADQGSSNNHTDGVESFDIPGGVILESTTNVPEATDGQQVEVTIRTICGCDVKTDLVVDDIVSEDLVYIPGSGGTLIGDTVRFTLDTLDVLDTAVFTYRAYVKPCLMTESVLLVEDNAEGTDQFESIKLQGNGNKEWVKSAAQSASPPNSWYAQDYNTLSDFALTLLEPVEASAFVELSFDHRYETEADYDGGVVEFSLDSGATWADAGMYFTENGYPSTITTVNTNSPIAGQDAFTGDSDLQFDTTGFIHSKAQIMMGENASIMVRFRFVTDGGVGGPGINGWYVDNIEIRELPGITNRTFAYAESLFLDSLQYGIRTLAFTGMNVYVDSSATGNFSGLSWEDAITYMPLAFEITGCRVARNVLVAEGTYLPSILNDRDESFHIPDSTFVYGGFPPGGDSLGQQDPDIYSTVLSGDIGSAGNPDDNSYHVLVIDTAQMMVLLDGVTLTGGKADGIGDQRKGAAVLCNGTLTLNRVKISGNTGTAPGQVILVRTEDGHLLLRDCLIYVDDDDQVKLLNMENGQLTIRGNTQFILE